MAKGEEPGGGCLSIDQGSLAELATQLEIARDVGYFNAPEVNPLIDRCAELGKMLGALSRARSASSPRAQSPQPRA
ncbi:MAG TPA: four helix bundle protein [Verrucomicrobiae bacterium]|jgi:four helix bundle protein|nr:four helix bundle protein [Verrucomicrobiae bacterium]